MKDIVKLDTTKDLALGGNKLEHPCLGNSVSSTLGALQQHLFSVSPSSFEHLSQASVHVLQLDFGTEDSSITSDACKSLVRRMKLCLLFLNSHSETRVSLEFDVLWRGCSHSVSTRSWPRYSCSASLSLKSYSYCARYAKPSQYSTNSVVERFKVCYAVQRAAVQ